MLQKEAIERHINQDTNTFISLSAFLDILKTLPEKPSLLRDPDIHFAIDNFLDLTEGECKAFLYKNGFTWKDIKKIWICLPHP